LSKLRRAESHPDHHSSARGAITASVDALDALASVEKKRIRVRDSRRGTASILARASSRIAPRACLFYFVPSPVRYASSRASLCVVASGVSHIHASLTFSIEKRSMKRSKKATRRGRARRAVRTRGAERATKIARGIALRRAARADVV
jgi:predicted Holliday junction resolvase-like endonuclease